jgi:hypothetical protein
LCISKLYLIILVFDLINVARIHNKTITEGDLLDAPTILELQDLANQHEWGLAYNASDDVRAIAGMQLAGEILTFLNTSITSKGANKLGMQFGAYGTFLSFFGLANLQAANVNFTGVPDYASSMVVELFTASGISNTTYPATSDLQVRFLYSNGSTGVYGDPIQYPMFGTNLPAVSWSDFQANLTTFAVSSTEQWCTICGNTTGSCAPYALNASASGSNNNNGSSGGSSHMSLAVAGVIGAMITLAVVLGLEALIALVAGLRVVKKGAIGTPNGSTVKA